MDDKEQQVPPSTEGQSHLVFYTHTPGSRLVLYAVIFANHQSSCRILCRQVIGVPWKPYRRVLPESGLDAMRAWVKDLQPLTIVARYWHSVPETVRKEVSFRVLDAIPDLL